jgi:predicted nucleic acid-binding protein
MNDVAHAAQPLFIDTGAFFARFNDQDDHHQQAKTVFNAIRTGELAYRPLYTSGYVLSELATLTLRKDTHAGAVEALNRVADSPNITVIHPNATAFAAIRHEFEQYSDHQISFVDQSTAVLARERDITHVFAFDRDFATLGLTRVPSDTGEA